METSANQQKKRGTAFLTSGVLLALLCLNLPAFSQVGILGNWGTGTSHTKESGTDRVLIFIAHGESTSPMNLSNVTYGGQSMTKVVDYDYNPDAGYAYAAAFILKEAGVAAASGGTFSTTWSGTAPGSEGYASVFLSNVYQTTPTGATGSGGSTSNPVATSSALVTNDGDMVILAATCGNAGSYTLNNGFTKGAEQTINATVTGTTGHKSATGANETPSATYSDWINRQMIIGFVVRTAFIDPNMAGNPNPSSGADEVLVSTGLSWDAPTAYTPSSYDVYFGTNSDAHSNPQVTVDTNSYDPPGYLDAEKTYYWAVDSNDDGTIYVGEDWSFTTSTVDPNNASNPDPSNGASHVPLSSVLSWDAPVVFTPTSYEVYFGTNPTARSNPGYMVDTNSYDPPGDLEIGTTYYWVVDSNDDGTIYYGEDWSFTSLYDSTNILTNPSFESGTNGWNARNCSISAVTSPAAHSGTYCARAYDRTETWQGIQQDVTDKMVTGQTYTVSGWVRTSTSDSSTVQISFQQTDGAGTNYYWAADGTASNSDWVQISGSFTLDVTGTLATLLVYFEGPDSGIDIYVDDVVVYGPGVTPIDPNRATNPTPINGAGEIFVSTGLSWNSPTGYTPSSYDVYFGTDANVHSNPKNTVYTSTYDPPGDLAAGTTYYWAVDSNDSGIIYDGNDWSFTTAIPVIKWRAGARCFLDGPSGEFDDIAVKDPSIVYYGGKWHLFYTGRDDSSWRMGYVSAPSISDLNSATRYYLSSLNGGSYFCAPQVFWFEEKSEWYLIYQSGAGPTFSTNTDINDPGGWSAGQSMGFSDGVVDYWCIADSNNVYCFYSPLDTTIKRRSTTVEDFPYNWSSATTVATEVHEASHVYKNLADGRYYMMLEDVSRHFELWVADNPGGTWIKLAENWAAESNLIESAEHWTDQVSHGEIIRAGVDEKLEIDDIYHCEILIQGVVDGDYGDYENIPYDLGLIEECPVGPADLDIDCDVDFMDFEILAWQWRQPPGEPSADIAPPGGDGIVDMDDLSVLVNSWLLGK